MAKACAMCGENRAVGGKEEVVGVSRDFCLDCIRNNVLDGKCPRCGDDLGADDIHLCEDAAIEAEPVNA